ncbi:MAG: hypothetical protein K8M05_03225, partial [Deltaproteobacteria bacterium]|nr:hypothetical protein [Kofleriaceae bacterium]
MPDAATVIDAGVIDAPPPLVIPTDRPVAKGKRTTLREGETKSVGHGVRVTFAHQGHKHLVGGGAVGFYELTFARGGKTSDERLSTHEDDLEAELDALGVLVVVTTDGGTITITTVGKAPRPLDEDQAAELIEAAATRHGLPVGGSSYGLEDGVLRYAAMDGNVQRWRARIGLYTQRIWFLPPRPPAP